MKQIKIILLTYLIFLSTSEKHSQNDKKLFFFFQSLASYMELSREKKTEFAFFGTLEALTWTIV